MTKYDSLGLYFWISEIDDNVRLVRYTNGVLNLDILCRDILPFLNEAVDIGKEECVNTLIVLIHSFFFYLFFFTSFHKIINETD